MNSILQLIEQYSNQSYIKIAKLQQALQKLNQEKERLEKELALLNANEASKTLKLTVCNTGTTMQQYFYNISLAMLAGYGI
jgi:Tfp pilus assembly protein PilE